MPADNKKPTILFIDSGIGGLTIVKQVRELLDVSIVYVSDNDFFPYGDKSQSSIINRLESLLNPLLSTYPIDAVVIGCNTATVSAIDYLRGIYSVPFVGVVPPIKPAARLTKTGKLIVLATRATVNSRYLSDLVQTYGANCEVVKWGCAGLADWVEERMINPQYCSQNFEGFMGQDLKSIALGSDIVVLGCTHYTHIKSEIQHYFGDNVTLVEPSHAVAKRLQTLLIEANNQHHRVAGISHDTRLPLNRFYVTSGVNITKNHHNFIKRNGFDSVNCLFESHSF
jgi:glutamate racemase